MAEKCLNRVKETRENLSLSLRQVASLCNISPSTLSCIENNKTLPSFRVLQRLANVLETNVEYLMFATDDPTPYNLKCTISLSNLSNRTSFKARAKETLKYKYSNNPVALNMKEEIIAYAEHIDNLIDACMFESIDIDDVSKHHRFVSKKGDFEKESAGESELRQKYEKLFNLLISLCYTSGEHHIENVNSLYDYISKHSSNIKKIMKV